MSSYASATNKIDLKFFMAFPHVDESDPPGPHTYTTVKAVFNITRIVRDILQDFSIEKWRKWAKACRRILGF